MEHNYSERLKKYSEAQIYKTTKLTIFQEAYKYSFPERNQWLYMNSSDGTIENTQIDKTIYRYDVTAIESLEVFSSNIQNWYANPYKKIIKLIPGQRIEKYLNDNIKKDLDYNSDLIKKFIDYSNFNSQLNLAAKDCGISTGLLQLKKSNNTFNPLKFEAIPMHQVVLGEHDGKITNVWRKFSVPACDLQSIWPNAKLSDRIKRIIEKDPDTKINILESTIYYPLNPKNEKYEYTVDDMDGQFNLLKINKRFSEWIPFRWGVSPGEIWGSGPVLQVLDLIRIANTMAYFEIRSAGYQAANVLMKDAESIINPNLIKMQPGAIIDVENTLTPPIVPLQVSGDVKFSQLNLSLIQQQIRNMMYADPISQDNEREKTATEVQILQDNWVKKSSSSFWRIQDELMRPLVSKVILMLADENLLKPIITPKGQVSFNLDDGDLDIEILNPLYDASQNDEANTLLRFYQSLSIILPPPQNLTSINTKEIPGYFAEKYNIPQILIKSTEEITQSAQDALNIQNQLNQQNNAIQQNNDPNSNLEIDKSKVGISSLIE
jgi:hypothetical protein